MSTPYFEPKDERREQELRIQRQIAFASGLFQGDITIRTLLESLAEGVVVIDNSGTILLVNSRAEQMFGYPKKELIGKPHSVLIPERFRKVHDEHEAHFFAEPRIRPMGQLLDLAGRRQDGSEFPVEISLSFIETINGVLALAFISDITLRKQYELHLRKSEELSHILIEGVKDYAIFMLDVEGNIQSWNEGAEQLKGYRAEEITGKHFSCFYPEEDRAVGKPLDDLKKAAVEGRVEDEGWLVRKDGSRFRANVIITALRDENGNLHGFSNVTRDITERKRAEEALRKSELKLSKIFHSVPAIIGITTVADGECIDINEAGLRTLGYRREEMVGKTMLELGVWESKPVRDRVIRVLEEDGMVRDLEINFRGKNGKTFTGLFSAEPIAFDGERYMLSIVNDITDRKRMEEEIVRLNRDLEARATELEAANRELEAFNYTVAHDLRKPLSVIYGYSQVIRELCGDKLEESCNEYVQEIVDGIWRMNSLIDTLLKFSRLTHMEPRRETVDLSSVAQAVAAKMVQSEPCRRVEFRITGGISVIGDANLLQVVLENLIGNAWKYTGNQEEGVIEFGVTEVDGKPVYFVRDNGAGFDRSCAEKMFQPFQRLPGTEEFTGHGIGLATVERIIGRHGGKVWAEGGPGTGATFYFTL